MEKARVEAQATASPERGGGPIKSDLQVLQEIRDFWMGIAATEQKEAREKKRPMRMSIVGPALRQATANAAARAPFMHARLASVTHTDDPLDLSLLTDEELAFIDRIRNKAAVRRGEPGGVGKTTH